MRIFPKRNRSHDMAFTRSQNLPLPPFPRQMSLLLLHAVVAVEPWAEKDVRVLESLEINLNSIEPQRIPDSFTSYIQNDYQYMRAEC